jgi:tripartite-type tricarboxylate transporter receptor subunit TctC
MPELANYGVSIWFGVVYPAGVPAAAVSTLNAEIKTLLASNSTQQRFAEMGGVSAYGTPEEFADFLNAEIEKWRSVIRREGLELEIG